MGIAGIGEARFLGIEDPIERIEVGQRVHRQGYNGGVSGVLEPNKSGVDSMRP